MKQKTKFKDTEIGVIPEDWEVKSVKDFCSKITSGGTPSRTKKEYWEDGKILWLKTKELIDRKIYQTEEKITDKGLKNSSAKLFQKNTIVMAMYGATVGKLGIIKKDMTTNQACCAMIVDLKKSIPEFLFYSLLDKREGLINLSVGAAQQNLNQDVIKEFNLPYPLIPEQHAIAKILSDLDSKIELLQKQNKTLEAIGQAIFKHWFVDFEFPNEEGKPYKSAGGEMVFNEELGKEIPKGWEVKSLDKIADYLNGLALQKYPPKDEVYLPVIKIKELRQGITTQSDKANPNVEENYIINNGDILFSWSGSLMVVIWGGGKGALNQHLFKVTSENFEKWFYYYWTKHHLEKFIGIAKDKATTMGHIKRKHLAESEVLVSNKGIMEEMNKIMEPIIDKIINNKIGIIRFQKTRDLLLPKLMSGEVRINV